MCFIRHKSIKRNHRVTFPQNSLSRSRLEIIKVFDVHIWALGLITQNYHDQWDLDTNRCFSLQSSRDKQRLCAAKDPVCGDVSKSEHGTRHYCPVISVPPVLVKLYAPLQNKRQITQRSRGVLNWDAIHCRALNNAKFHGHITMSYRRIWGTSHELLPLNTCARADTKTPIAVKRHAKSLSILAVSVRWSPDCPRAELCAGAASWEGSRLVSGSCGTVSPALPETCRVRVCVAGVSVSCRLPGGARARGRMCSPVEGVRELWLFLWCRASSPPTARRYSWTLRDTERHYCTLHSLPE